jgi:hypothetical protein
VAAATVKWTASQGDDVLATGRGAAWSFTAPGRGAVMLAATVVGTQEQASLVFHVVPTTDVAGWAARSTGRVLVDGAPAIQGEALAQGTIVDARAGVLTMQVRARTDSALTGTVKLEGTRMELRATAGSDGAMRNVVRMEREAGTEQLLVAEVEHLDGTRYVQVETPDAVAMVKGTRFLVRLDQDGTDVAVDHGWVVVRNRVDAKADLLDVRDESQTYVPRVIGDDGAAHGAPGVRPITGFDDLVDAHRGRMVREVREHEEGLQPAPQAAPPAPRPGTSLTAPEGDVRQPGLPVANPGGDGTVKPPLCGPPRCPAPTTTSPSTASPLPGTTVAPIRPPTTSEPAPIIEPKPDGTTSTPTNTTTEPAPRPCATCAPAPTTTAPKPPCTTCTTSGTGGTTSPNAGSTTGTTTGTTTGSTSGTCTSASCSTGTTYPVAPNVAPLPTAPRPAGGTITP